MEFSPYMKIYHPLHSDGSCQLYNKILSLDKNGNILRWRSTTWMLTDGM
jgi:hypothetical protein